jgi:hypothetical protein
MHDAVRITLHDLAQHTARHPSRRAHLDGCHFAMQAYDCTTCAGHLEVTTDRDPKHDRSARHWLRPDDCQRCAELSRGARRTPTRVLFTPYGPRRPCHQPPP